MSRRPRRRLTPDPPRYRAGMPEPSRPLDPDAATVVFRRAAELQRQAPAGLDRDLEDRALLEAGEEVGLAPDVVRRALREYRAGLLADDAQTTGGREARAARVVRGEPVAVGQRAAALLRRRRYQARRYTEDLQVWTPRQGVVDKVRDRVEQTWLESVTRLELRTLPAGPGATDVVVAVEQAPLLRRRRTATVAGAAVGAGGLAVAVAAAVLGEPSGLLALPVAGAAGGVAARSGAARYRRQVAATREVLEGFLDDLDRTGP